MNPEKPGTQTIAASELDLMHKAIQAGHYLSLYVKYGSAASVHKARVKLDTALHDLANERARLSGEYRERERLRQLHQPEPRTAATTPVAPF